MRTTHENINEVVTERTRKTMLENTEPNAEQRVRIRHQRERKKNRDYS